MTPQDFVAKWKVVQGKEIANAQPHFLDLCDLLSKPKPQPNGEDYTFEESVKKSTGGAGRADVWKRACFAWEYKGPGRNLDKAYNQLLQYKDALDNPPLLIVSDILTIQVHTNFTNSVKKVYAFTLDDLLDAKKLEQLARVFDEPEAFKVEINAYAHELAQVTIWIGYIQWLRDNGFGAPSEPILRPLDTVLQMDAILAYDAEGQPAEPAWPGAEVIVGNPPFLGDKKMRAEMGDAYVETIRTLYADRIAGGADLVTYWFEKARAMIVENQTQRAGLLSTNSIRSGANRRVLERIKETGDIFMACADRPWVIDGAAVRVSMVGFDDGSQTSRCDRAGSHDPCNRTVGRLLLRCAPLSPTSAVFDAYGWPHDLSDEAILERLLALNLERGTVHPGP